MGLSVVNAAKNKLIGLLSQKLAPDKIFVGQVMVLGSVKGTAFDNGQATIDPAAVAVLVEAMACKCPIISTDCPSGPREILDRGRAGVLVPVEDEAALSDALVRVLSDQPLRTDLARRAYTRAQEFTLTAVLDGYRSIFSPPCA